MIVQMDNVSAPSSREHAQLLYEKNIELENKRRKSAQARVPSDPNAWHQMRENYEAILLEDHSFSEQHNIEYALWQLHYRRIEELRSLLQSALSSTSTGSNASKGAKVPGRPERITKIRQQFKTFLSEATGFYHDLIQKIRAKYGLPLGYFSEDSDSRVVKGKDGKKPVELKKGLISCHRCLIYLGDLARYKGLYGEGDSKTREYTAASSYYMQAASLWPSSGNPHHQLAILASYSGDELVAVYRYFRSLAAEHPFVTARDNLIVAFEKNRQSFSQLLGDSKFSLVKDSPANLKGKVRGRGEVKHASKNTNLAASVEDRGSNIQELQKLFCICFVRLNGILFTRTSLETFPEVLISVSQAFSELLSSGPEERFSFGEDATENGVFLVRLTATLIFTVHNVKKEADGQSYAEIVQRAVLLQNAFTAAFELMGHMLQRTVQLPDPSSSYLLPAILVFLEWLACHPDVASGVDADEKQGIARVNFWNSCIMFLNKILPFSSMSSEGNEDETCFYNMSPYEEGETENLLALWEDFELRGFLPLLPAQTILDFSRSEVKKEKSARTKRVLAAGKALANFVKVDQKLVYFDAKMKKFVIGAEPQSLEDRTIPDANVSMSNTLNQEKSNSAPDLGVVESNSQMYIDSEEEDEVIVFKPLVAEKPANTPQSPKQVRDDGLRANTNASVGDLQLYTSNTSAPPEKIQKQLSFGATTQLPMSNGNIIHQQVPPLSAHTSKWLAEEAVSLASSLKAVRFVDNGHLMEQSLEKDMAFTHPISRPVSIQPSNANSMGMFYGMPKMPEPMVPSQNNFFASSGALSESFVVKASAPLQTGMKKSPVSRPVRHLGPPPGFSHVPPKQVVEPISSSDPRTDILPVDDYSWLDGYQLPKSSTASALNNSNNLNATQQFMNNTGFVGTVSFPFPGRQGPPAQIQAESMKGWQNYQALEHLRAQEQQLQQQFMNGNQQFTPTPEQYHGQSIWSGRYIV